jgi:hypothetical protein
LDILDQLIFSQYELQSVAMALKGEAKSEMTEIMQIIKGEKLIVAESWMDGIAQKIQTFLLTAYDLQLVEITFVQSMKFEMMETFQTSLGVLAIDLE